MPSKVLQQGLDRATRSPQAVAVLRAAKRANRATYRLPRPALPDRHELAILLNRRGLVGCGVEVGVKQGEFSEALLELWNGRHLISVDPWAEAPAEEYDDVANVAQATHDRFYEETLDRLRRFGGRSSVWRMTGEEAAARLPHHSLDFVYLDARHDRRSVTEDLSQWFDKVRPGGVIAGHDYVDGEFPEGEFGVRSAVDAYFDARRLGVSSTFADPPWPSWFVLIPRG